MTFPALIKSEMGRIARKASRSEIITLKTASRRHRTDIAAIKRRIADLERIISRLAQAPSVTGKPVPVLALRWRREGFVKLRIKLDLTIPQMGRLLGVSAQTITKWETGETRPLPGQLVAIAQLRKIGKREALRRLERF